MKRLAACFVAGLVAFALAAAAGPGSTPSDDFFIVSSVDSVRSAMVLKRPTEVTLTMRFTAKTRCANEKGKPMRPADLRAGDTVFVASAPDSSGQLVATTIRQGAMTLPELRRRYLRPGA